MATTTREVPKHRFAGEAGFPPDLWGRVRCTGCGRLGKEGDQRHPKNALPLAQVLNPPQKLPPTPEAARELDARILGERP